MKMLVSGQISGLRIDLSGCWEVSQQLRDYESTQSKYKELHAERMAEALQRRSARDAAAQERLGFMDELKLQKMRRAMEQAEEQLELKQQRASECLELWREGLRRCRRHQRMEERKVLASHRRPGDKARSSSAVRKRHRFL